MVTEAEQRQISKIFDKIDGMQTLVIEGQTETNRQLSNMNTRITVIETKLPYIEKEIEEAQTVRDEVTGVHNIGYQAKKISWFPDSATRRTIKIIGMVAGYALLAIAAAAGWTKALAAAAQLAQLAQ